MKRNIRLLICSVFSFFLFSCGHKSFLQRKYTAGNYFNLNKSPKKPHVNNTAIAKTRVAPAEKIENTRVTENLFEPPKQVIANEKINKTNYSKSATTKTKSFARIQEKISVNEKLKPYTKSSNKRGGAGLMAFVYYMFGFVFFIFPLMIISGSAASVTPSMILLLVVSFSLAIYFSYISIMKGKESYAKRENIFMRGIGGISMLYSSITIFGCILFFLFILLFL